MSDVVLRQAGSESATSVSNTFIDFYMKGANGEYVKVYLYLLRCLGDPDKTFSVADMADALDHTQRDISRALSHWEREGLLRLEYTMDGELSGICLADPSRRPLPVTQEPAAVTSRRPLPIAQEPPATRIPLPVAQETPEPSPQRQPEVAVMGSRRSAFAKGTDYQYSPDEICLLNKDTDVQEILWFTERYLGHPLSSTESNKVLFWYDGMNMSADLVEYLVEYCVDQGHKSIHYMNKVALNWTKEGITTVEEAKASDQTYDSLYRIVANGFGIAGRNLSKAEREYLDKWSNVYGCPDELVEEACKRTILKAGRPSFQYADSILASWYAAGAATLQAVQELDTAHKQVVKLRPAKAAQPTSPKKDRFHNFNEHGYDYNALQAMLIQQ